MAAYLLPLLLRDRLRKKLPPIPNHLKKGRDLYKYVIAAGNDGGTPFNPADNLVSELERMVAAGMSAVEALAVTHSTAAELLRLATRSVPWSRANWPIWSCVLDADPLADISAVCQVYMVIQAGQLIRP